VARARTHPPQRSTGGANLAAVGIAGVALSAIVTSYVLRVYLPTLNTPHTSLEGVAHAPSAVPLTPGLSRRLTVVVIDGLSYDAAHGLAELLPLRQRGVFRSLAVEFPTYTSAALVSFMTGLTPRDSGTRRNGDLDGVAGLDTVLRAAGDAHVPLRLFSRGFEDFGAIMAPPPGTPVYEGRFAPAVDMARRGLAGGPEPPPFDGKGPVRAFDLFHWGEVDETAHLHGSRSPEYEKEVGNAAAFVTRYAASIDLDQDALVVLSDHGHLPEGGHGGDEPVVSHAFFLGIGGFFRRGVALGERPMRDVAATLSILGGLRVPSSNLGLPMLDALALDDREAPFLLAGPFDEAARFLCRLHPEARCAEVDPLVARLHKADAEASEAAQALHAALTLDRDRELDARRADGGPRRLGAAVALLAASALLIGGVLRKRGARLAGGVAWPALVAPLVLGAVYTAFLAMRGYRPTFSHLMPVPLFARDATPAAACAVAAVAALAWLRPPGRHAPWVLLAATAVPFALLAAWVGADPVTPPPNVAGVLVFLLGPALLAAAAAAIVLAWMERRRRG
jgi:hypothetical protein